MSARHVRGDWPTPAPTSGIIGWKTVVESDGDEWMGQVRFDGEELWNGDGYATPNEAAAAADAWALSDRGQGRLRDAWNAWATAFEARLAADGPRLTNAL